MTTVVAKEARGQALVGVLAGEEGEGGTICTGMEAPWDNFSG
jgi:hypothetical protein